MSDVNKKQTNKNKFLVIIGFILIMISPIITDINLFYYPSNNLFLSFLGIVFFDGLELASISFICGMLIIIYQLLLIVFTNKNSYAYEENVKSDLIYENYTQDDLPEPIVNNQPVVNESFEQVDDLISQLDLVLKKSRHDVFNLMLDPNGINSPDDFQSAVESLELALSSLRAIKKQVMEIKKDT